MYMSTTHNGEKVENILLFLKLTHYANSAPPRLDILVITIFRYLFLGYEDAENKRLLFDENSMALEWKERWYRNIAVSDFRSIFKNIRMIGVKDSFQEEQNLPCGFIHLDL